MLPRGWRFANRRPDPLLDGPARRCGGMRTSSVNRRTTLLLVRLCFHLITRTGDQDRPLLAEDDQVPAFAGALRSAEWLPHDRAESLLSAQPEANVAPDQATDFVRQVIDGFAHLRPHLERFAQERVAELLDAHRRVRSQSRAKGVSHRVEPQLPPDVLGIFLCLAYNVTHIAPLVC